MSLILNRRRTLQLGAASALALGAGLPARAQPQRGGRLRVAKGHGQTTDSLDPRTFENGFMIGLAFAMHNFLTEVKADGTVGPELAESWEASDDASQWTFRLKPGVAFHNGKAVTAQDVIASYRLHMGEESTSAAKPIVQPITDITAPDERTVVFALESGNADFPFIVSDYHLAILPSEGGEADWRSGVGAGAYRLDSFDPGVRAAFTKFEDYHKDDRGWFESIEMLAIVDPTARTNALLTGEVDAIDRVERRTAPLLARRGDINMHEVFGQQHFTFVTDTRVEPFSNNDVRLALKWGINRQEMVDKILNGFGVIGNDHPIGPNQRFFAEGLEQREFDPDKARFHLKQAGLDSLDVTLHTAEAAFAGAVDAAQLFAESAREAGINLRVAREPNDGYWSDVWMVKPFSAVYWGGRPTEDWMFATAYEAGVPWNDAYWDNARFNELLRSARAELDQEKRREMYYEMQEIVRDQGGAVIPMFASYLFATSPKVGHDEFAANWDQDGEKWAERWWFQG